MVLIRITDLDLPEGVTHNATDWQVATDMLFSNIILESLNDSVNLTTMIFNDILDVDQTYYARARSLLSTGYTIWGNLDAFIPKDAYRVSATSDLPTSVTPPTLTTDSPVDNHGITMFNITASGFAVVGNASHISTTWIIEDLDGNVIWVSNENSLNKDSILVDDVILREGDVYIIKAIYHASSGDSSQPGCLAVYIPEVSVLKIKSNIYEFNPVIENTLELEYNCGITQSEWIIYDKTTKGLNEVYRATSDLITPLTVPVPSNTLATGKSYMVVVRVHLEDTTTTPWSYDELSTY